VSEREEIAKELRRVVDRLDSMPVARAQTVAEQCHTVARTIVERTSRVTDAIPQGTELPRVGPTALGAQIAVVGRDYLRATSAQPDADADASVVLDTLVDLRRSLP
jgi:ABC-type hemin transport system substrate-binding protein